MASQSLGDSGPGPQVLSLQLPPSPPRPGAGPPRAGRGGRVWFVGGSAAVLTHSGCSHADLAAPPLSYVTGETPPGQVGAGQSCPDAAPGEGGLQVDQGRPFFSAPESGLCRAAWACGGPPPSPLQGHSALPVTPVGARWTGLGSASVQGLAKWPRDLSWAMGQGRRTRDGPL